jgi:hypothetical protein
MDVRSDTVELDARRFVALELSRRWPKYVMAWSVRERSGESDFPVAGGEIERMPASGQDVETLWDDLRAEALRRAQAALDTSPAAREQEKKSFLGRLFNRGAD